MKKVSSVMFFLMSFLVSSTRKAGRTGIKEVNRFCSEKNHNFRGIFTPQNNRALYTVSGLRFIVPLVKDQPFIKVITTLEQNSPNPFRSNTVTRGLMDAMASVLPFVTYNYSLASIGSDKTGKYWTVLNIR